MVMDRWPCRVSKHVNANVMHQELVSVFRCLIRSIIQLWNMIESVMCYSNMNAWTNIPFPWHIDIVRTLIPNAYPVNILTYPSNITRLRRKSHYVKIMHNPLPWRQYNLLTHVALHKLSVTRQKLLQLRQQCVIFSTLPRMPGGTQI